MRKNRIQSYSGPYFLSFGLNIERYSVSLCIQPGCGKIQTRITQNMDTFYAVNVTNIKTPSWKYVFFQEISSELFPYFKWNHTKLFFARAPLSFDLTISNIGLDKLNEKRSYILDVVVWNIACFIGGSTCSDKGFFNKILYGIWMTLIYTNLLVSKHLLQPQWKRVFKNLAFNIFNLESNIEYQGKLLS